MVGLPKSNPMHKQVLEELFTKLQAKDPDFNYQLLYTGANFSGFLFQTGEGKKRLASVIGDVLATDSSHKFHFK